MGDGRLRIASGRMTGGWDGCVETDGGTEDPVDVEFGEGGKEEQGVDSGSHVSCSCLLCPASYSCVCADLFGRASKSGFNVITWYMPFKLAIISRKNSRIAGSE